VRLLAIPALAFVVAFVPAPAAATDCGELLDEALLAVAMTRADLTFRTDYADVPDSFRLSAVDSLLKHPLDTEPHVRALAAEAMERESAADLVRACARELDLVPEERESPDNWSEPVGGLVAAIAGAAGEIEAALAGLDDPEIAFLRDHAPVLLEEDEFDPEKPIDEREHEAREEELLGDRVLAIAAGVDYSRIAVAALTLSKAVDEAVPMLRRWADEAPGWSLPSGFGDRGPASGDVAEVFDTDAGLVVIGGPGRTVYEDGAALIIDLGGDDVYGGGVGGGVDGRAAVVIDLSGDDVYLAGDHALGAGFLGVGILVDMEGDDRYEAGNFAMGSGLFGAGILIDRSGDDTYAGDTCTEGAGAFGIGILSDRSGNDSYDAALFSQAFGFVEGVGLLADAAGNDVYFAGGRYTDEIRYFDHFLSLSQGFGFGMRPDASGGVGVLADGSGNDVYVSDIFGQGASYWFAIGGLVDAAGNDQYVSYQYAQGAATHITAAALIDLAGDDNYVSKGVSQGCGHDLAVGILHDLGGDDNYTCHDLSQAAGNANGIGILIDDAGDDAYSVRDPDNTHGYGNLRRDYGSVGIFIDCAGRDSYSGRGANDSWWTGSAYGIGIDSDGEAP
jgi:hypothetical protein